jgi:hypothetical protein
VANDKVQRLVVLNTVMSLRVHNRLAELLTPSQEFKNSMTVTHKLPGLMKTPCVHFTRKCLNVCTKLCLSFLDFTFAFQFKKLQNVGTEVYAALHKVSLNYTQHQNLINTAFTR